MQDLNLITIQNIIKKRAKNHKWGFVFISFIFYYLIYKVGSYYTEYGNFNILKNFYFIALFVFVLLLFLFNFVLYRINIKNSKKLDVSYIKFNKLIYIKFNKLIRTIAFLDLIVNIFKLLNPKYRLEALIQGSFDSALVYSTSKSINRAIDLDEKLVNYFNALANGQLRNTSLLNDSIYPIAAKGVLADKYYSPINQPNTSNPKYKTYEQEITLKTPSYIPRLFLTFFIGLIFPAFFASFVSFLFFTAGWGLLYVYPIAIIAMICLYIWFLKIIMDKIGATEPLKISIVSILYQIGIHGVLANIHNPILGISDSYWRIIVATLGNAIIMTILVFVIDKPGIKQPLQKID